MLFHKSFLFSLALMSASAVAVESTVTTNPEPFDGPTGEGPAPLSAGKSDSGDMDEAKKQRIINQLCRSKGASGDLDRVGPFLWFGGDAVNQGECQ